MYIPTAYEIDDRVTLYRFIEHYGFATLISNSHASPLATHVPLLLDRSRGTLSGHFARANPHWKAFKDQTATGQESLAIFHGPHAYISPTWYAMPPAVPTWNYTAVHVYGVGVLVSPDRTREIVDLTVKKYEESRPNPWPNVMPGDYRQKMLAAIVGFEIPITRIEGKFKLGQNRSAADQAGMLAELRNGGQKEMELAKFIDDYHEKVPRH